MGRVTPAVVVLVLAAGCGGYGGKDHPSCSGTDPCDPGSYCAATPDGGVCWPDREQPQVVTANVKCSRHVEWIPSLPCTRDAVLQVTAEVIDDRAVGQVTVAAAGLDPGHTWPMTLVSGMQYAAEIPLTELPFPFFEHGVTVTVSARDEAGNEAQPRESPSLDVSRWKWKRPFQPGSGLALSSPAILSDGRIALAGSDMALYIAGPDGLALDSVPIGETISGPPAVGADAIWLATQSGKLLKRTLEGAEVPLTYCETSPGSSLFGPPAVFGARAVAGSSEAEAFVARALNACNSTDLSSPVARPPVIDSKGRLVLAMASTLQRYVVSDSSSLSPEWTGAHVSSGSEPPMVAGDDAIWSVGAGGELNRITASGESGTVAVTPPISAGSRSGIALADATIVIPDWSGVLRRVAIAGTPPWTTSHSMLGRPTTPLLLSGQAPGMLVTTSEGWLYQVSLSDGAVLWGERFSTESLQPANIWTEPGASISTAYLAGGDGTLYAIFVDGVLDASAPWPKAFHDSQNTSNAGVTP